MPQPRIDMRMIRAGVSAIRTYVRPGTSALHEAIDDLIGELDDRDDGATILIALTPREAEVVKETLRRVQARFPDPGSRDRLSVADISAIDSALAEMSAALRGVVVQS